MATLRSDGRYTVAKRVRGKQIFGYGRTPEEAEDDLAAKVEGYIRSIPDVAEILHDFAKRVWYPVIENVAELSRKKYVGVYKNHIKERLGPIPMNELEFAVIQVWGNDMNKRGVGSTTVRYAKELLGAILKLAVFQGIIPRSPTVMVKVPKKQRKRERVLSPEKAQELLEAVDGTDLSAPVFLAAVLGLRTGEIAGRKWIDLDRQRGELRIQRQRQAIRPKGVIERDLETDGSHRVLRLPRRFIDEVDRRGNLNSAYVCAKDGKAWVPDTLTEYWAK